MTKKTFNIIVLVLIHFIGFTQNDSIIIMNMRNDVKFLSSDELHGRETGTKYEKKAAKYIINEFKKKGLTPKGTKGFLQKFKTKQSKSHHSTETKTITGMNVIGYYDNKQKETIIIGAHYDHIGNGSNHSLSKQKGIHNGADDNASGVSIIINLIDLIKKYNQYNYLFIGFSGEEKGLLGSSYFTKNPTINLNNVRYMINLDMVGRLKDNKLAINGTGTSNKWNKILDDANIFDFKLIKTESGMGASDHTSFYLNNIPSIHLFTGQHEDYHKTSDDYEKINFNGMYKILMYLDNIIQLSSNIDDFDFQKTKDTSKKMGKFNVTLGIMPDYMYSGQGVRIDGVSNGKTADKFGMLKGDIILQMGENKIDNMVKYMDALNTFQKGDTTNIKLKRNEEIISTIITFQ